MWTPIVWERSMFPSKVSYLMSPVMCIAKETLWIRQHANHVWLVPQSSLRMITSLKISLRHFPCPWGVKMRMSISHLGRPLFPSWTTRVSDTKRSGEGLKWQLYSTLSPAVTIIPTDSIEDRLLNENSEDVPTLCIKRRGQSNIDIAVQVIPQGLTATGKEMILLKL